MSVDIIYLDQDSFSLQIFSRCPFIGFRNEQYIQAYLPLINLKLLALALALPLIKYKLLAL